MSHKIIGDHLIQAQQALIALQPDHDPFVMKTRENLKYWIENALNSYREFAAVSDCANKVYRLKADVIDAASIFVRSRDTVNDQSFRKLINAVAALQAAGDVS